MSLLRSGLNSCVAPSSHSWSRPLASAFILQRILEHRAAEHFRREIRDAGERELLALGEGVADVDGAVVVQADDVAREGFLGRAAIRGHEGERIGDAHLLVEPHVVHAHAARVLARAQAHERDAVAVLRIHVRLDLEHEAGELRLDRLDVALQRVSRGSGAGACVGEMRQQLLDAEVARWPSRRTPASACRRDSRRRRTPRCRRAPARSRRRSSPRGRRGTRAPPRCAVRRSHDCCRARRGPPAS